MRVLSPVSECRGSAYWARVILAGGCFSYNAEYIRCTLHRTVREIGPTFLVFFNYHREPSALHYIPPFIFIKTDSEKCITIIILKAFASWAYILLLIVEKIFQFLQRISFRIIERDLWLIYDC